MTNYSEAQRQALRAFAETLERGELDETRDFEPRRRPESFYDAPVARRERPYYEGEFERYERLSRGLTHQPYEVNPRHAWPTYDRSESQLHDYSVSCFWSNYFLGFIFYSYRPRAVTTDAAGAVRVPVRTTSIAGTCPRIATASRGQSSGFQENLKFNHLNLNYSLLSLVI